MPDFYEGPEDVVEDVDDEVVDEVVDDEPEGVEAPTVDEFDAWIADKDKSAVRKTFERFTNELESVKNMERELAPLAELRQNLQSDPGLIRAIEDYYARGGDEGDDPNVKVEQLERKFHEFQSMTATERELERLHAEVSKQGNPDFEDVELLRFAAERRIGSLDVAYKAMKHDDLVAAALKRQADEIKKNAAAKVETRPKGGAPRGPITLADLERMGDAEFMAHTRKT